MNHLEELAPVFRKYPDVVWCIDAVSSFGGVKIDVDAPGHRHHGDLQPEVPRPSSRASASPRSLPRRRSGRSRVKNRGYYFDLLQLLQFIREKNFQYPSTMSISHIFALDIQMDRIIEGRVRRAVRAARADGAARAGLGESTSPCTPWRSTPRQTVTCIKNTRGISVADLNKELGKRNLTLSNGYGKLKEQTFRIAHMGDLQMSDIDELLGAIEEILKLK